jgi:hypothetical protein
MNAKKNSGNVLFLILIAVVLFAALSHAVTSTNRGSGSIQTESDRLAVAELENYIVNVTTAVERLKIDGCMTYDYTPPQNWLPGSKRCHVFHPDGGGAYYKDLGDTCPKQSVLESLSIGQSCGVMVYAGDLGGDRIYTTRNDQGLFAWNNGGATPFATGQVSTTNGKANTDALVVAGDLAAPYNAANACRALGADWYLPSRDELNLLYLNHAAIGGFVLTGSGAPLWYWSSSETNATAARRHNFRDNWQTNAAKGNVLSVRCIRR